MKRLLLISFSCISVCVANGQNAENESVQKLIECMGIQNYIEVNKYQDAMWVEPQYENDFLERFDQMIPKYINDAQEYLLDRYTANEIEELLKFYESPLGKKLANTKEEIEELKKARDKWGEYFLDIFQDLKMGEYRKKSN